MGWLDLPRVPEPEAMDDSGEVEAYASAAAQEHLDRIDNTFVEHAVRLLGERAKGAALDLGSGPGRIVLKLAAQLPDWGFVGLDRSPAMVAEARKSLAGQPGLGGRVAFLLADANRLPFPAASFDLVMSNSVLHHLAAPAGALGEMARVARPGAAILLRDLRRPSRLSFPLHVRWHGRHYSGVMYELFCRSVRSAYTGEELEALLRQAPLAGARIFHHRSSHLGIERPVREA
jgi:ubiquinone/menaquinone biosynthesis C-methylase UbiE